MIEKLLYIVLGTLLAACVAAIVIFLWRESRRVSVNEEIVLASAEKLY